SCATRLSTAGENTADTVRYDARPTGRARLAQGRQAERAERPAELRLRERLRRAERLVHGGEHEVLEELRVVGVDRLGVDRDLRDLAGAGRLDGDHAAAGRGLDRLL